MYFALFVGGIVVGIIATYVIMSRIPTVGTLRVDRSIPDEEPMIFLEIYRGVGDITRRRYVRLDVKDENYLSQD